MSRLHPEQACVDVSFTCGYGLTEAGVLALEDYAVTLTRALSGETLRQDSDAGLVTGLHLCGLSAPLEATARDDIEAFAKSVSSGSATGLGWS